MQLMQMLEDGRRFAPLYRPVNNSDHLPMTLCAMSGLGASDAALLDFKQGYQQQLHDWQAAPAVTHWQDGLGQGDAYAALLAYFSRRLATEEIRDLVDEVLSHCVSSVALDAFHPIIRLGYAVDFGCRSEVAAGLAYVVSVHRDMPLSSQTVDLMQQVLTQADTTPVELEANRFGPSIFELVEREMYPTGKAEDFATLAEVALKLYQSTRNFFALHLVTATQALRCCLTPATESVGLSAMSSAILASHLVLGSPAVTEEPLAAPAALDQEHAYKYVWACLCEHQHYGRADYVDEIDRFRQAELVPSWAAAELFRDAN